MESNDAAVGGTSSAAVIDEAQWQGGPRPSAARMYLTNALLTMAIAVGKRFVSPSTSPALAAALAAELEQRCGPFAFPLTLEHAASGDSVVIRALLVLSRNMQSLELRAVRQPFIGLVCPPTPAHRAACAERMHLVQGAPLFEVYPSPPAAAPAPGAAAASATGPDAVFYVHGGGFISGNFGGYRGLVAALVCQLGVPAFFPQYALAPEAPLLESVADVRRALEVVIDRGFRRIACMGDSAGGNLVALALQQRRRRPPGAGTEPALALALISPVTDLSTSAASHRLNDGSDPMFRAATVATMFSLTLRTVALAADDPRVSCLFGDFEPLADVPTLILAANDELFLSDALLFAAKAAAAGSDVRVTVAAGLCHAWPIFWHHMPEAAQGIADIAAWARAAFSAAPRSK